MTKPSSCNSMLQFLPEYFHPSSDEVIVGRGKKIANHPGNRRLMSIVQSKLEEYSHANDKTHKTFIISRILRQFRQGSSCEGFVKRDAGTGRWYQVKDPCARTNIAQSFRDALHGHYRSSKVSKQRRRLRNNKSPVAAAKTRAVAGMQSKPDQTPVLQDEALWHMIRYNREQSCQQQYPTVSQVLAPFDDGRSDISDILSAAMDVIKIAQDLISPLPDQTYCSSDQTAFESLPSATFTPTDESENVGNPFELTPL